MGRSPSGSVPSSVSQNLVFVYLTRKTLRGAPDPRFPSARTQSGRQNIGASDPVHPRCHEKLAQAEDVPKKQLVLHLEGLWGSLFAGYL